MVSFQCEGCGDIQTKKKLDAHWNRCHAPFTCIDCMTTFQGNQYKGHTSCMTEDQKYQGALYREKPSKTPKRKSVSILEPADQNALVPHKAYVEDADDDVPPAVPTPPPAVPAKQADDVFDYLVADSNQGTPRITYTEKKDDELSMPMTMKNGAPSVFSRPTSRNDYRNQEERENNSDYDAHGYSYGTEPVNPRPLDINGSTLTLDFMTPAPKVTKTKIDKKMRPGSVSHSRTNSGSEKKRKRDEHGSIDVAMTDVPETIRRSVVNTPGVAHSGLTGGLSRMVTNDDDFPYNRSASSSPARETGPAPAVQRPSKREDPGSPLKRSRRTKEDSNGLGISLKGRAGKVLSMVGGALTNPTGAGHSTNDANLIKTRRRASSSDHTLPKDGEKRERKKHKVTRHNGTSSANVRVEHKSRRQDSEETTDRRKVKAIEYHRHADSNSDSDEARRAGGDAQMVVFGAEDKMNRLCDSFMMEVTKGERSANGYSVNKVLKRWHREREIHGTAGKIEEEKELWKGLRLKKNDRGEIVLFF